MTKEQVIEKLENLAEYHRLQREKYEMIDSYSYRREGAYQNGQYVALQEAIRIIKFEME